MPVDLSAAFLQNILEHPEDDFPRLALADYLDEQGQEERAEFIRVQVELVTVPPTIHLDAIWDQYGGIQFGDFEEENPCWRVLHNREQELLKLCWTDWYVSWPAPLISCTNLAGGNSSKRDNITFRRGFVEHIALPCAEFLEHAEALFRAAPIQSVKLTDREPDLEQGMLGWHWASDHVWDRTRSREVIPWSLYFLVQQHRDKNVAESPEDSRRWLNAACIRYGRKRAGLTS